MSSELDMEYVRKLHLELNGSGRRTRGPAPPPAKRLKQENSRPVSEGIKVRSAPNSMPPLPGATKSPAPPTHTHAVMTRLSPHSRESGLQPSKREWHSRHLLCYQEVKSGARDLVLVFPFSFPASLSG